MPEPMTCLEARRELLADPLRPSEALRAHLDECVSCAATAKRARSMDERLYNALKLPVPEGLADRLLLTQTTRHRRRLQGPFLALAAAVVLSVGAVVFWQFGVQPVSQAQALERYVVDHIKHEPAALVSRERVPRAAVVELLAAHGLELTGSLENVVFAKRCPTPDGMGLHFVVNTDRGPVTLIYMPGQSLGERVAVEAETLSGYVTRFRDGALALVGAPGQSLDDVAARVGSAVASKRG